MDIAFNNKSKTVNSSEVTVIVLCIPDATRTIQNTRVTSVAPGSPASGTDEQMQRYQEEVALLKGKLGG